MKSRIVLLVAAGASFAGLIAFLPAKLIEGPLNAAIAPAYSMTTAGTIWHGNGVLRVAKTPALQFPITWRYSPSALMRLRAGWEINVAAPSLDASLIAGAGFQSLELRALTLRADLTTLSALSPAAQLFRPAGRVQINSDSLTTQYANFMRLNGEAQIHLTDFGLGSMAANPVGTLQLKLTGKESAIDFAIEKSSGAVVLDGGGNTSTAPPRRFTYVGHAMVATDAPEALKNAFNAIGKPSPDGRIRIDQSINW